MAHANPVISKIKLPQSETVYDICDKDAVHQGDIENYFFIVETVKQGADYYLDGITFDKIIEKFSNGGNMVCHVDGTDYIPLLSVTSYKIIFSGIYNTTSVSLDFDTSGKDVLTISYLGTRAQIDAAKANAIETSNEYTDTAIASSIVPGVTVSFEEDTFTLIFS